MAITVTVQEEPIFVTISENNTNVIVNQTDNPITVETSLALVTNLLLDASEINAEAHGSFQGGNLQEAVNHLADKFFRQTTAPTGASLEEGDLWYDTDDDQLKVYRETSPNNFEFVPLAAATDTMDNLDGGLF